MVPSSANLTELDQQGDYVVTSHMNGAIKLWKFSDSRSWTILVQFQTPQAALTCCIGPNNIVSGHEAGYIRIFSIADFAMTMKIGTNAQEIVKVQLVPKGLI